jgi:hypothetical protein
MIFIFPAHWQQAWRDNRFKRLLWQSFAPEEHGAGTGTSGTRDRLHAAGDAETGALRNFRL